MSKGASALVQDPTAFLDLLSFGDLVSSLSVSTDLFKLLRHHLMRSRKEPKEKANHRLARLHWKRRQKVNRGSLWAKIEIDPEMSKIDIDEEEFNELFKADLTPLLNSPRGLGNNRIKGAAVRVIDAKRANNGGIILAHVKMTHDEMADAVDCMYVAHSPFNCHVQS